MPIKFDTNVSKYVYDKLKDKMGADDVSMQQHIRNILFSIPADNDINNTKLRSLGFFMHTLLNNKNYNEFPLTNTEIIHVDNFEEFIEKIFGSNEHENQQFYQNARQILGQGSEVYIDIFKNIKSAYNEIEQQSRSSSLQSPNSPKSAPTYQAPLPPNNKTEINLAQTLGEMGIDFTESILPLRIALKEEQRKNLSSNIASPQWLVRSIKQIDDILELNDLFKSEKSPERDAKIQNKMGRVLSNSKIMLDPAFVTEHQSLKENLKTLHIIENVVADTATKMQLNFQQQRPKKQHVHSMPNRTSMPVAPSPSSIAPIRQYYQPRLSFPRPIQPINYHWFPQPYPAIQTTMAMPSVIFPAPQVQHTNLGFAPVVLPTVNYAQQVTTTNTTVSITSNSPINISSSVPLQVFSNDRNIRISNNGNNVSISSNNRSPVQVNLNFGQQPVYNYQYTPVVPVVYSYPPIVQPIIRQYQPMPPNMQQNMNYNHPNMQQRPNHYAQHMPPQVATRVADMRNRLNPNTSSVSTNNNPAVRAKDSVKISSKKHRQL